MLVFRSLLGQRLLWAQEVVHQRYSRTTAWTFQPPATEASKRQPGPGAPIPRPGRLPPSPYPLSAPTDAAPSPPQAFMAEDTPSPSTSTPKASLSSVHDP